MTTAFIIQPQPTAILGDAVWGRSETNTQLTVPDCLAKTNRDTRRGPANKYKKEFGRNAPVDQRVGPIAESEDEGEANRDRVTPALLADADVRRASFDTRYRPNPAPMHATAP